MSAEEATRVARAVGRRLEGVPLQHIEGTVEFRRLVLVSDGRALIPRPETEQLVDLVAAWVRRHGGLERVLEIGVGSGAIAISLIEEHLAASVVGLDVSLAALEQAAQNAEVAGVGDRLDLRRCPAEIWPALQGDRGFAAIISNPPYVAAADIETLAPEVRDHEPRVALDGGDDGLDIVRRVLARGHQVVANGGPIFLEIGADQGPKVLEILRSNGGWQDPRIETDLADRPRFATACAAPVNHGFG